MKRFFIVILFLVILFAAPAHAAWTVTVSLDRSLAWQNDQTMHIFKFDCASDASSSGDLVLTTEMKLNTTYGASVLIRTNEVDEIWKSIAGGLVYFVKYEPSTTAVPASATTITIDDETGWNFFSETVSTASTTEGWPISTAVGALIPMTELTLAMTTLGDEDEAIIWVWVLR